MPSLVALRAFVAVGDLGSMRKAGERLNVDHASVWRHVRALEARLGVRLAEVRGRNVHLTPEGQRYYDRLSQSFEMIDRATLEVMGVNAQNILLVAPPGLAHLDLLPALPALELMLPGWNVVLRTDEKLTENPPALDTLQITFEFRDPAMAPPSDEVYTYSLLRLVRIIAVASPEAIARWPAIRTDADLLACPIIRQERGDGWEDWLRARGIAEMPPTRGPDLPNTHLALDAALWGQGVALVNEFMARRPLRDRQLVELLASDSHLGSYNMKVPTKALSQPVVRKVKQWAQSLFSDLPT